MSPISHCKQEQEFGLVKSGNSPLYVERVLVNGSSMQMGLVITFFVLIGCTVYQLFHALLISSAVVCDFLIFFTLFFTQTVVPKL